MRILQVIPHYLPASRYGGIVFATHALSRALVQRGHHVEVYTTYQGQTAPLPPSKSELDGVIVNYFMPDFLPRLAWAPAFARKLKREVHSFDIVHLHSVYLWPTWNAARQADRYGVPYILSPRGMLVKDLIARRSRRIKSVWIKLIEERNLRMAAAIHVTSTIEKEELDKFSWKLPHVEMIPNGVDWEEAGGAISPDILAITQQQPYALFFGRLSWKKGLEMLIESFARTRHGFLVVAGTDDEGLSHRLRQTVEKLRLRERVHILPKTITGADKHQLFRAARFFVLPSYSENFGNAVLEAMAAGLAVLVTPEVGAAEIVLKAEGGCVVPKDPILWGNALERFLQDEDEAKRLGKAGRTYVLNNCSWGSTASHMERLYQECAAQHVLQ